MPIDLASFGDIVDNLDFACQDGRRTFLSTPNLNFWLLARKDKEFFHSLIQSDLVIADGMPLIWIAKILNIRGVHKVSGSSLFEHLSLRKSSTKIRVFFFGGAPGVAEAAHHWINASAETTGMTSSGYLNPGIGSAKELSKKAILDQVNASDMDFLVVSLGAQKGQNWILRNLQELNAPMVSHLGAVLAFTAGKTDRAPKILQRFGVEWLWRIKEEPFLFRRYWQDGIELCHLMITTIIPYAFFRARRRKQQRAKSHQLVFEHVLDNNAGILVKIKGHLTVNTLSTQRLNYTQLAMLPTVRLDLSCVDDIDEFGVGQILILLKYLNSNLSVVAAPDYLHQIFHYEYLGFLFSPASNTK
jgi:N-acetylglucosaminyldiphosphoundecaprenol N-acetyl-beta-D-mannosaminyltransferase